MQASLKDLASRLQLEGKNSLSSPLKQLDEAKLWMSGPVIAGTAQMPCSNATTKAAVSYQSTSSTTHKKNQQTWQCLNMNLKTKQKLQSTENTQVKTEKNNSLQRTFQCGSNSLLGAMKAKGSAQAAESLGRLGCEKAAQSAVTWPALLCDQFCPDSLSNTDFLDTLGQDSSQLILTT